MPTPSPLSRGLLALLLFASVPCTIRHIPLDHIAIGIVRLGLAAFGLGVFLMLTSKFKTNGITRRAWLLTIAGGLTFGLHWLFYFLGIKLASASLGALGFSTYGVQLIVFGWVLKLNPVTSKHLIGVSLAVLGSILIIPEFSFESRVTTGLLSGFLSGTFYALLPIIHKKNEALPDDFRAWGQFTFALLIFIPLLPYARWEASPVDWSLAIYLGLVVTLIGHTLWVQATTALPTTTTSIISYLYLPTAIFLSWLTLHEPVTRPMVFGGGLIIVGNLLGLSHRAN